MTRRLTEKDIYKRLLKESKTSYDRRGPVYASPVLCTIII